MNVAELPVQEAMPGGPSKRVDIDVKASMAGLSPPLTPSDDKHSLLQHGPNGFDIDEENLHASVHLILAVHREVVSQKDREISKLNGELTQVRDALKSLEEAARVNQSGNDPNALTGSDQEGGILDKGTQAPGDSAQKREDSPNLDSSDPTNLALRDLWLKDLGAELTANDTNVA